MIPGLGFSPTQQEAEAYVASYGWDFGSSTKQAARLLRIVAKNPLCTREDWFTELVLFDVLTPDDRLKFLQV